MITLFPEFETLNNPDIYNPIKEIATLKVASQVCGHKVEEFMSKITSFSINQF